MNNVTRHLDRSVSIGRDATGNIIQTGDENRASLRYDKITLPPANRVDIAKEIAAIKEILRTAESPESQKLTHAIDDAELEVIKPTPDRDEVGDSLERILKYAKTASGYVDLVESLKPHIINAVGWLGTGWSALLHTIGLSV